VTLLREGAVVRPLKLFSRAMREMKKSVASIFEATSDVAGALRHAPACVSTFSHVTTSAHMPATHYTPHMDVCQQAGDCIINPTPGFEYQHNRQTSHLQSCSTMQKTTSSWTGREVSTLNPARRTAVSGTALVTTPATEECHRKPVKYCQQGGCP
jgi:hypothetical protein